MLKKPIFVKFKIVFRGHKGVLKAQKNVFIKSDNMLSFPTNGQSIICSWIREIKLSLKNRIFVFFFRFLGGYGDLEI